MNISFDNDTFAKIGYLAGIEGISIAAYVSKLCDEHVKDLVQANYTLKDSAVVFLPSDSDSEPGRLEKVITGMITKYNGYKDPTAHH